MKNLRKKCLINRHNQTCGEWCKEFKDCNIERVKKAKEEGMKAKFKVGDEAYRLFKNGHCEHFGFMWSSNPIIITDVLPTKNGDYIYSFERGLAWVDESDLFKTLKSARIEALRRAAKMLGYTIIKEQNNGK